MRVLGSVAAVLAVLAAPLTADAHAYLASSTPAAGTVLVDNKLPAIDLRFSEAVVGVQVTLSQAGHTVKTSKTDTLDGGLRSRTALTPLAPGLYLVTWRAVADDGHLTGGQFSFAVGAGEGALAGARDTAFGNLEAAALRWVFIVGLLGAAGGLVSRRWIWPAAGGPELPRFPVVTLLQVGLLGLLGGISLEAARQLGSVAALSTPRLLVQFLSTRPAQVGLLEVALIAIALYVQSRTTHGSWVLLPVGLTVGLAAVSGHPGTSMSWYAAPANIVHVAAVAVWFGGLGDLLLVGIRRRGDPGLLSRGARRYALVALLAAAAAILTGILDAFAQFATGEQLFSTGYGLALVVKSGILLSALALAFLSRRFALPDPGGIRPTLLRRLARVEVLLLAGVLAAAAVQANAQPPRGLVAGLPDGSAAPVTRPLVHLADGDGTVEINLRAYAAGVVVNVVDGSGRPIPDGTANLFTDTPDGFMSSLSVRSCGGGCTTGELDWQPGRTTIIVVFNAPRLVNHGTIFDVGWPPQPRPAAALTDAVGLLRSAARVGVSARVITPGNTISHPVEALSGTDAAAMAAVPVALSDTGLVVGVSGGRALVGYDAATTSWYRVDIDETGRPVQETVVTPASRTELDFTYPAP